ncbi:MAG: hypothetical protein IJM72_00250, partial [Deltaproteobacteria bacterium]|nr:hypothetical protein [Deltaproteobacteria bacterium]
QGSGGRATVALMQNPLTPPSSPEQKRRALNFPIHIKKRFFSAQVFTGRDAAKILHTNPVKFPKC